MSFWGAPADPIAWLALLLAAGCGVLGCVGGRRRVLSSRGFGSLIAVSSFALSWGYIFVYLKGGPRIIDATTYLLQAKTLASGQWAFAVEGPLASYQGRFLVHDAAGRLSGIFPPGYPLALALSVAVGAPMVLGPLVGAAISLLTYALARRWFRAEGAARLAAVLSLLSFTLRYHTADTMSHGWCALLWLSGAYAASSSRRDAALIAGLLLGWLIATRPVTGLIAGLFVGGLIHRPDAVTPASPGVTPRAPGAAMRWACFAAGILPGLLFLVVQQHAVTGEWFTSSQYSYYARSDHPPGCFRYGFGSNIGCQGEHGDFLQTYMASGYGWKEALATTARRLTLHASDAGNSPLFAALLLWCVWQGRRQPGVRWLAGAIVAQVLAYVPFYFDGNYPAGGARLFADILPFEHVILGWGMGRERSGRFAPALALAGFALYGSHQHAWLATEQGGRPAIDARLQAAPSGALVFVAGDHAFNLGYEPDPERRRFVVARWHGDEHDHALWRHLGRPASFIYRANADATAALLPYVPQPKPRREFESLWPVMKIADGTVLRTSLTGCAEGAWGLRLSPAPGAPRLQMVVPLWVGQTGWYRLAVGASPGLGWRLNQQQLSLPPKDACSSKGALVRLEAGNQPLLVTASETAELDFVALEWVGAARPDAGNPASGAPEQTADPKPPPLRDSEKAFDNPRLAPQF